jgi:glucokinase
VHRSTITEIVTPLIDSGILREAAPEEAAHRRGRPPVGLTLRGERQFVIGVNIGVRRTQVGAATTTGLMLAEETFDTPPEAGAALAQIGTILEQLRTALAKRSLVAIGVSVPGPTDSGRSKLLFAPHLGWREVAVADVLHAAAQNSKHSGKRTPVIVANDATAAATYEARRRLRSGKAAQDDFILVRAGTGIGVGLVLAGEVYQGSGSDRGLLGEFGHMTIVAGGEQCACGSRGCWEVYASAAAAVANYAGRAAPGEPETQPRFIELVARARAGEWRARTTLACIGANLGIGISNVITGLGVSRVVVSGRVVHGWEFLHASLKDAVAHSMAGRLSRWSIEAGEATGAGLGGAVEVAIEHHLTQLAQSARAA